jgi:LemA protein
MKKGLIVLMVIVCIVVISAMSILGSYNTMVSMSETVDLGWAQVESQYQRRFDLIPGLVNSTKGYLKQEQKVFGDIAEARTRYSGAASQEEKVASTSALDSALSRLLVVMENYPQLKSDQTVKNLTDELAGTENRIQVSRSRYNEEVKTWNVSIKRFPRNVLAGMFGFDTKSFFESDENASKAVNVDLIN